MKSIEWHLENIKKLTEHYKQKAMEQSKKLTWAELKEFVNQLPEEVMDNEIIWWGEERGGEVTSVSCLREEYGNYGGDSDYIEPRSAYENEKDYEEDEFDVLYEKGTPIIYVD